MYKVKLESKEIFPKAKAYLEKHISIPRADAICVIIQNPVLLDNADVENWVKRVKAIKSELVDDKPEKWIKEKFEPTINQIWKCLEKIERPVPVND